MVKEFRYIFRRILIGVGIAIILGYVSTFTGFIIPVYAETESGGGGGSSLVQSKPEPLIGVDSTTDSNTTISSMHGLNSNVFYEGAYEYPEFGLFQYGINSTLCNNQSGLCPVANSPTPQYYTDQLYLTGGTFRLNKSDSNNVYVYGSNIYFNFDSSIKVKNGNHYTFLLEFTKEDNLTYFTRNPDMYIKSLNVTDDLQHYLNYDISNNLDNISIKWTRFTSDNKSTKWAFLKVDFDINDVQFNTMYLQDIYLSFDDGENPSNVQPIPLPNLFFGNGKDNYYFDVDSYFIENGTIDFVGWNCSYSDVSNECFFADNYFDPNYDYTYASDIRVFDNIEEKLSCADNDIICHIKQVFESIKAFFVRVSNFFRDLLDDSYDFVLDTNSDMTPISDLLTMPLSLVNSFINGVNSSCSQYNFGFIFNKSLTLPCINLEDTIGHTLFVIVDGLCAMFMLLNIGRLIITFFDKSTSLDDMFALIYHHHDYDERQARGEG